MGVGRVSEPGGLRYQQLFVIGGIRRYAAASAFVYPFLFEGVLISNPKFGMNVPLKWELGHLNQLFYLVLSFAFYLIAAYWTPPAELVKSLRWFVGGVMLASLIGLYQFAAMKTGAAFSEPVSAYESDLLDF